MQRQCREQFFVGALAAYDSVLIAQLQRRLDQLVRDQLGQNIGDADRQARQTTFGAALEAADHLLTEGENLVGITKNEFAGVRRHKMPSRLAEKLLAERFLERFELCAHRRLGQVQFLAGPRHATRPGHRPEIEQMMIVQPFHERQ